MSDRTSSDTSTPSTGPHPRRHLRFSHDEGQPDEVFHQAQQSPAPPSSSLYTNPFTDLPASAQQQQQHPPYPPFAHHSANSPAPSSPAPAPVGVPGYRDTTTAAASVDPFTALRPPLAARTVGSGLPHSGLNRNGHASSPAPAPAFGQYTTYPAPAGAPPAGGRGRYGSTSEETLVGDLPQQQQQQPPLKPALRRSSTEEHLRLQAAREAAGMVDAHLGVAAPPAPPSGPPRGHFEGQPLPPPGYGRQQRPGYDGWGDEEADLWMQQQQQHHPNPDQQSQERAAAGILSNLLRLYGNGAPPGMGMYRGGGESNSSGGGGSRSSTGSYYGGGGGGQWEREQDLRRRNRKSGVADEGAFPRGGGGGAERAGRGMRREMSTWTVGTSLEDKVLEPEDPRAKRRLNGGGDGGEKDGDGEKDADTDAAKEAHKDAAKKGDELAALDAAEHRDAVEGKAAAAEKNRKKNKYKKYKHKEQITAHVATLLQKQEFILKLAKALMTFGAPSHRLESQLNATAAVLNVNAQFIHVPSVVIASFGDSGTHTSETKFIKASGGLNLGSLHKVHEIYKDVVHDEMGVEEGIVSLERVLRAKPLYNLWTRIALAGLCAGIISPMGFAGSFVDAFASGAFGALLAFLNLFVARRNAIFSNIFEISVAALISFAARGLSTTGYFCYESVASAGVVMVLPGYVVLCGSLELASKNLIAGSVRMVYAIIYTLFLGFSIAVGSDVFYLFDPKARASAYQAKATTTVLGTFTGGNSTLEWQGAFTFTNQTNSIVDATQASLQKGSVMCYRDPQWEWWRQGISIYWLILLVPLYSTLSSLANMQPLRSRELPVMVFIAVVGYIANRAATTFIFDRSDVVSFIGATVIGLLGNLYSRVFNGTSFTAMATGVLFLVPGGIAAAGGLAMNGGGNDSYNSGMQIGLRMVSVAIGITIGLFFSSFIVYSIGTKKKGGGLGFAF
ncbi:hypothetical protein JCM6882_009415 [Rhodosporidiobolus microsporus]